jgi:hypothetical protein
MICTRKVVVVMIMIMLLPKRDGMCSAAMIDSPIATPAWLNRHRPRYRLTAELAPDHHAPSHAPAILPAVLPDRYASAVSHIQAGIDLRLSLAPPEIKKST